MKQNPEDQDRKGDLILALKGDFNLMMYTSHDIKNFSLQ